MVFVKDSTPDRPGHKPPDPIPDPQHYPSKPTAHTLPDQVGQFWFDFDDLTPAPRLRRSPIFLDEAHMMGDILDFHSPPSL